MGSINPLRTCIALLAVLVAGPSTFGQTLYWIHAIGQSGTPDYGVRRADLSDMSSIEDVLLLERDISRGPRSMTLETPSCNVDEGRIFVAMQQNYGIQRFDFDSSGPVTIHVDVGADDMAVDSTNGYLFFTNWFDEGALERSDLDGSNRSILITEYDVSRIELDVAANKVYWRSSDGTRRANLDGTGVDVLVTGYNNRELAMDPIGGKLYWEDRNAYTIMRANLDGTNAEVIIDLDPLDTLPSRDVTDILIDPRTQTLYWYIEWYGQLWRANADGSNPEMMFQFGSEYPRFLAIDLRRDCNGNGLDDACDDLVSTGQDCNNNGVPDECEVDCNSNSVPDDCDLTAGTSEDCNTNDIPDECEGDCNTNNVPDDCDLAAGTSEDCNLDLVPDECQPNGDCNGTGTPDLCDITDGTSQDCDGNLLPDECDLANEDCNSNGVVDACEAADGSLADNNGNGIPDECDNCFVPSLAQEQLLYDQNYELVPGSEARFLAFTAGDPGHLQAIRVTFEDLLSHWDSWEGTQLYVQPPVTYSELGAVGFNQPGGLGSEATFYGATLGCTPVYLDWSVYGMIHVHHVGIIPSVLLSTTRTFVETSTYGVEVIEETCAGDPALGVTIPVKMQTAGYGDVQDSYSPADHLAPDNLISISDLIAVLIKFVGSEDSVSKPRLDFLGADSNGLGPAVDGIISIAEITTELAAFSGYLSFPFDPPGPPPTCNP